VRGGALVADREMSVRLRSTVGRHETTNDSMSRSRDGGIGDFDFLIGRWNVLHRRLARGRSGDTEWSVTAGTASAHKVLAGLGNLDEIYIPLPTGAYVGSTLRLYSPSKRQWSNYYMDSRDPKLNAPMTGSFENGRGLFFGLDTFEGKAIDVRLTWSEMTPMSYRWERALSTNSGKSWETNWIMTFDRLI
jgi:hypothetical protein